MKRNEYNEYRYIKSDMNKMINKWHCSPYGSMYTININGTSTEYRMKLDALYRQYGYHPASIKIDTHMLDENPRICYIYGQTWEDNEGNLQSWERLYTKEEKDTFTKALDSDFRFEDSIFKRNIIHWN